MKKFRLIGALLVMALGLLQFIPTASAEGCNPFPECKIWPDLYQDQEQTNEPNLPSDYELFGLDPDEDIDQNGRKCETRPWVCKSTNSEDEKTGKVTTPSKLYRVAVLSKMPIMGPDKNGNCWQRNINGGDPHKVTCPKKTTSGEGSQILGRYHK